ncbi:MAG: DUF1735 domain-containing protein [Prevotella sp.]|nr:DUF1735 domain-containing protein [Prevotella sp.]
MNKKISYMLSLLLAGTLFTSCKNGDAEFPDYEEGTTVYFAYQYPVRTIVLGDDEYDVTLDHAHKCQIKATFGGSYNGSNGSVTVAVDPSLCDNLTFEDGTPVQVMPKEFYNLSPTTLPFNGTMNGTAEVELTDEFFKRADAVKNTYVIPLVIVDQSGFGKILTGTLKEGGSAIRTDASQWEIQPMDYVLYCVKYQNQYSGYWLTHGTTSIDNIEKAQTVQIKTKSLNQSIYTVSFQQDSRIYTADLLLTFNGDQCTISSLTDGVTATGTGTFTDQGAKKSWGNKDRDLMELNYAVDFGGGQQFSKNEKLVWQRSGVVREEFAPIYTK